LAGAAEVARAADVATFAVFAGAAAWDVAAVPAPCVELASAPCPDDPMPAPMLSATRATAACESTGCRRRFAGAAAVVIGCGSGYWPGVGYGFDEPDDPAEKSRWSMVEASPDKHNAESTVKHFFRVG
jgi:hypothetical protein